jgi:hypothetical protein
MMVAMATYGVYRPNVCLRLQQNFYYMVLSYLHTLEIIGDKSIKLTMQEVSWMDGNKDESDVLTGPR